MGAQRTRIYVDSIDAKPGVKTRKEVVAADSNAAYASGYRVGLDFARRLDRGYRSSRGSRPTRHLAARSGARHGHPVHLRRRVQHFPVVRDASRIAFTAVRGNGGTRYVKATNGVGEPEELDKDPRRIRIDDWSRDGRYIIEELPDPKTLPDVWVVPQFGDKKPFPYLNSEYAEVNARLSPNGQWLAYVSMKPSVYEV